ncbi:MAG: S8 family peptidase [Candidatus Methanoperedens sp.]|nr:S8 family peptidase [Candidatus Methanoperedens sp.]
MLRKMRIEQRIFLLFFTIIIINGLVHGTALAEDHNVIIGFHQTDIPSNQKLVNDSGGKLKKAFHLINAISANMSDQNITKLKKNSKIAYIVNNTIYKASDEYTSSWGVQSVGSQPVHNSSIVGAGVNISVLDTGIYYNHEDLANNYKGGFDFVNNDSDPWDDNCISMFKTCHGTHVSGIIAAEHNGIGVVGVAPGANIYAVKIIDGGSFTDAIMVISGIEWSVAHNMNIISMSIESTENNIAVLDAINAAYNSGILLVASAGNDNGGVVMYPAAYDSVIAVSATDANDTIASFSAKGPKIELAAPGVNVNSTICIGPLYTCVKSGYGPLSGTSMSAPFVTGVAALIMSTDFKDVNGDGINDNKDVRIILQNTARHVGTPGRNNEYGYGIVDASNATGIPSTSPAPPVEISPPKIISSFPTSPVNDTVGISKMFNITTDQVVNVQWSINDNVIKTDTDITYAQYDNISASTGIWNVTAIASNINGSVKNSWEWNVKSLPPLPETTFNLTLKVVNNPPIVNKQMINLSKGNYSINIHNINLSEVDFRIYMNGVLQKRLSKDFEFSKKRTDVNFILAVNDATAAFVPYGKKGAIGYVTIRRMKK